MSTEAENFLRPGKQSPKESLLQLKDFTSWAPDILTQPDFLQNGKFLAFGDFIIVGSEVQLHRDIYRAVLDETSPFRNQLLDSAHEAKDRPRLSGSLANDAGFIAVRNARSFSFYSESQDFRRADETGRRLTQLAAAAQLTAIGMSDVEVPIDSED